MLTRRFALLSVLLLLAVVASGCTGAPTPSVTDFSERSRVAAASPAASSTAEIPNEIHWPGADWPTAEPGARGLDPARLEELVRAIPERAPGVISLLIIRGGDLVLERYFGPGMPDNRREIYSCTKSFISTLVGIAVDRGFISSLNDRVLDYFPGREFANLDPSKAALTLEHLLTMTAGLYWVEGDEAYRQLYYSPDWVQFMLDQPVVEPPGSRFNYCSGCSHLLSAILEESTGMSTIDFVVVFTSSSGDSEDLFQLIEDYILPDEH